VFGGLRKRSSDDLAEGITHSR